MDRRFQGKDLGVHQWVLGLILGGFMAASAWGIPTPGLSEEFEASAKEPLFVTDRTVWTEISRTFVAEEKDLRRQIEQDTVALLEELKGRLLKVKVASTDSSNTAEGTD